MWRTTVRQARGSTGRLAAAGIAIVLGTAFLTTVLLGGGVLQRTLLNAVSAGYPGADVVITSTETATLDDAVVARIRAIPGVSGADGTLTTYVGLASRSRSEQVAVGALANTPALRPELSGGSWPAATGQVVLDSALARRLAVTTGETLIVRPSRAAGGRARQGQSVRVVGLLAGQANPLVPAVPVLAGPGDVHAWTASAEPVPYDAVLVAARPGVSTEQLRANVVATVAGTTLQVRTADEQATAAVNSLTGGTKILTGVVSAFAVLALFVAGLVITNTLAVLVSQRTRQLALLRCVGATSGQVRRSVLGEAAGLGLVASGTGVLLGTALAAAATAVLSRTNPTVGIPGAVQPTTASLLLPVALGAVVTVLAALAPARAATRVSPLAALQPPEAPAARAAGSRWRLLSAVGLTVGGAALLALGVLLSRSGHSVEIGLLLGLPGGVLSFTGVLVGAVFWLPQLGGALARLAGLSGLAPARLTAANLVRHPRRTATTASALLIGVTLVSLMAVGAATARTNLTAALDTRFPIDLTLGRPIAGPRPAELGAATTRTEPPLASPLSADIADIAGVAQLRSARALIQTGAGASTVTLVGMDSHLAAAVVATPERLIPVAPGVAVVPAEVADQLQLATGEPLTLSVGATTRTLRVVVTDLPLNAVAVDKADLAVLAPDAPLTQLWAALTPDADPTAVVADARHALSSGAGPGLATVDGGAVERAAYLNLINTLLLIVTALLVVAVVIAFVGVANTMSLSVIERTRESALLRALGLTRDQLRAMLLLEGTILAVISALLGTLLGSLYGWAGATVLLGAATKQPVTLDLPWTQLAAIITSTLAAGALASVAPSRRAAQTPPVAALNSG